MTRNAVVTLPWSGEAWPGRVENGLPTFGFRDAPAGLATRRQLRAAGLCPANGVAIPADIGGGTQ